jgi:hypothetical protein
MLVKGVPVISGNLLILVNLNRFIDNTHGFWHWDPGDEPQASDGCDISRAQVNSPCLLTRNNNYIQMHLTIASSTKKNQT